VVAVDVEVDETFGKGVVGARGKSKAKLACDEEMDDAPAGDGGNGGSGSCGFPPPLRISTRSKISLTRPCNNKFECVCV
jgi:hypothetical protein